MRFTSYIPYDSVRIHTAAIYCSDGRIGAQTADFLSAGLGVPRYDRVCLPGGPASLAGHPQAYVQQQGVVDELHFLVEAHKLERVILIAHEGCAFYSTRLGLDSPELETYQLEDLHRATAFVNEVTGVQNVDAYFARLKYGCLAFEPV